MYKILIVDDEKIERNGIKLLLKQLDHEFDVSEAGNGMIALDMLKENEYDILLTDIKMPFMDGMELIEKVHGMKQNLKYIIFSGCSDFSYAKQAVKLGVADYILKPVDINEFKTTINKVVAELDEMILRAKCHLEKYGNVKKWFLAAYPDISDFTPAQFEEKRALANPVVDNFEVIEEAKAA